MREIFVWCVEIWLTRFYSCREYNRDLQLGWVWHWIHRLWESGRVAGETSWSFGSYSNIRLTVSSTFQIRLWISPRLLVRFPVLVLLIALIFIVIRTFIFGDPTSGWPSMVSIFLFVGGLQLLCLGIIGKYIGKIFLETKNRPLYFLKETEKTKKNYDKIKVYNLKGCLQLYTFCGKNLLVSLI